MIKKVLLLLFFYLFEIGVPFAQINVDSLIENYTIAVGGKKEWRKIRSFHLKMIGRSGNRAAKVENHMLKPHCFKITFHFPSGKRVLSYFGTSGQILDEGEIKPMPEDMQIEMREEPDFFDELLFYKEKGYRAEYLLDTIIEEHYYHKISLYKSGKDIQFYYINKANNLVEIVEEYSEEEKYEGVLFKTTFPSYKRVDKILFPNKMLLYGDDRLMVDYEITELILNPKLKMSDFFLGELKEQ